MVPLLSRFLSNCHMLEGEIETQSSRGSRVTVGSIPLGIDFFLLFPTIIKIELT